MGLLVRMFVLVVLFSIPVEIAIPKSARTPHFVGFSLAQLLATGAVIFLGYGRTGSPLPEVFALRWPRRSFIGGMLLQLGGAVFLSLGLAGAVQTLWPTSPAFRQAHLEILEGGGNLVVAVVFVVLLAPLSEELLFRGLILHGLLRNYSRRRAIWTSALLFAAAHLDPWKFLPVLVGGVLLAWWRVQSGSLWPGFAGHMVVNALPVLAHELLRQPPGPTKAEPKTLALVLGLCLFGALLLAGGAWLMVRSRDRQEYG